MISIDFSDDEKDITNTKNYALNWSNHINKVTPFPNNQISNSLNRQFKIVDYLHLLSWVSDLYNDRKRLPECKVIKRQFTEKALALHASGLYSFRERL